MEQVVDEGKPVTDTKPPENTGPAAFDAARASVKAAPVSDDTPVKDKPAEDPEKVADQPKAPTEDPDTLLTPEELAALPPKDRARAEKWQAKLTQKAQALSAKDKELDEWKPLIETLKTDPAKALEHIASQIGFKVTKAGQDTPVETTTTEVMKELPEGLEFLKPVFEALEKRVEAKVRAEIEPVKKAHSEMITEAAAVETDSTIKAFSTKYPGWEAHEAKMIEIGKTILPTPGMSDFKYMETLHTLATADLAEADKMKKAVDRVNKSVAASETKTSGMQPSRVVHALPPPDKRSMRDAFEAAKRGEVWEK